MVRLVRAARLRRDPLRELDVRVAVELLGYRTVYWDGAYPFHDRGSLTRVRDYSTKIEAAWEIVEVMNTRGWRFDFLQKAAGDWLVRLHRSDPAEPRPIHIAGANAPTVTEAIVRASLAALEAKT